MKQLSPYFSGLGDTQRLEVEQQANYIEALALRPSKVATKLSSIRIGRNDKCPCGSGMKFKKCCM
nr:SEC-C metal-binding domain-containing protein [Vibrio chagasii]